MSFCLSLKVQRCDSWMLSLALDLIGLIINTPHVCNQSFCIHWMRNSLLHSGFISAGSAWKKNPGRRLFSSTDLCQLVKENVQPAMEMHDILEIRLFSDWRMQSWTCHCFHTWVYWELLCLGFFFLSLCFLFCFSPFTLSASSSKVCFLCFATITKNARCKNISNSPHNKWERLLVQASICRFWCIFVVHGCQYQTNTQECKRGMF